MRMSHQSGSDDNVGERTNVENKIKKQRSDAKMYYIYDDWRVREIYEYIYIIIINNQTNRKKNVLRIWT